MKNRRRTVVFLLSCAFLHHSTSVCASELDDLASTPLSGLVNKSVYSVSKYEENADRAASAVFVLTSEDIKRSGATSIPEVLRLVPGLDVARTSSNKWAISARGFNDTFANKLLVLMDGRTLFTPQFSGVFWDAQDTVLEDIERIEIIRGPGAALWGANAVNGVINITTKKPANTQGTYLQSIAGTEDRLITTARYGGKTKDGIYYRNYVKYFDRGPLENMSGVKLDNSWRFARSGFRAESQQQPGLNWNIQGDVYTGDLDTTLRLPEYSGSRLKIVEDTGDIKGGNVLARLNRKEDGTNEMLQLYYDRSERHFYNIEININTYDLDYQNIRSLREGNQLLWGGGLRYVQDSFKNSRFFAYNPESNTETTLNAFIQNKQSFLDNTLDFILGSKFEHNPYSGFEIQPTSRVSYMLTDAQVLWAAISRAVRTPTRSEEDVNLVVGAIPNRGFIHWVGDERAESESVLAYELGHRWTLSQQLKVDTALFYNKYDNLRTWELGAAIPESALSYYFDNKGEANSWGGELTADYLINKNWNIITSYSQLLLDVGLDSSSTDIFTKADEGKSPRHQVKIHSAYNIGRNIDFDIIYSFVSELRSIRVPAYQRADVRLAWRPIDGLELSLVGTNLFDDAHREFSPAFNEEMMEIGRDIYLAASLKF